MLKNLTSARWAVYLVPLALLLGYAVLPFTLHAAGAENVYFEKLARLAVVAAFFTFLGAVAPIPLHRFPKMTVSPEPFLAAVLLMFSVFVLIACATADQIPIVASMRGADAATISLLREQFLKAREGWQASFVYINAIFAGFLIPYSLAMMFLYRYRFRWVCFGAFLLYTISFSEKAFFLKALLPLFYLVAQRRIRSLLGPATILACMLGLLVAVTVLSRLGSLGDTHGDFFSAQYIPNSPGEYMVWRCLSVPLVSASDALKVFHVQFDDTLQWGATSSFLARISGREVVPFERLVFASQWGQNETGTGSSNSVFITEAFVNFGLFGVASFAFLVGVILHFLSRSKDYAFQSMWMLFALNIYVAGLIGTLLSNGLLLVLVVAAFVRFRLPDKPISEIRQLAESPSS